MRKNINNNSTEYPPPYYQHHLLYEEENKIILELGRVWIKCGFGGEALPRHVYRNTYYELPWKMVKRHEGSTIRTSLYRCLYEIFTE
jgi:hypothetical protein